MAAGGRYYRGAGYESNDYMYDYGHDSPGSYSFLSESWMTSGPVSSRDGSKHMGPGKDSYGAPNWMGRYGAPGPNGGYGSQRGPAFPPSSGWRGAAQEGYRGHFRPPPMNRGSGTPLPLASQGAAPERSGFQSLRGFTVNSYFGGGFKQKSRKRLKDKQKQAEGGPPVKKAQTSTGVDEGKGEKCERERDGDNEGEGTSATADGDDKPEAAEGTGETERKQMLREKRQESQGRRRIAGIVDRIQFVCSLCKFRTFYNEELINHLQSEFHKELFSYVGGKLPKQAADFLQEYIVHKNKKTEERCSAIEDLSTIIQEIFRNQDLTHDLGMEHFVKKVETAHCAACDVFIPMNFRALQQHIRSPLHNQKRRNMMENSKKMALSVARSILDNKTISEKLNCYIKGENPFADEQSEATANDNGGGDPVTEGEEPITTTEEPAQEEELEPFTCSPTNVSENVENKEDSAEEFSQDDEPVSYSENAS